MVGNNSSTFTSYTPVHYHSNVKWTLWIYISYWNWGYSIAMLVYQRVVGHLSFDPFFRHFLNKSCMAKVLANLRNHTILHVGGLLGFLSGMVGLVLDATLGGEDLMTLEDPWWSSWPPWLVRWGWFFAGDEILSQPKVYLSDYDFISHEIQVCWTWTRISCFMSA